MEVKWTAQQEEAVFAPVSNILVTAAAGAGKTQVLTGRILQRILSGADVSRMLIVTFTNAAAAEMRSRIAKALSDELSKNPGNEHIMKQTLLLPLANIQTIHSFCLDVIKNNFFKAGISPDFKIADEAECKIMKAEAIDEAFDSLYEEENEDFLLFSDSFSNAKNDDKAADMVLSLFDFAESMPFPEEWLLKQCEMYESINEDNFEQLYFVKTILDNVKETIYGCLLRIEDAGEQCADADGLEPYCEMFEKDAQVIKDILSLNKWDELSYAAGEFAFDRKKTVRGGDEDIKNAVSDTRVEVKKEITEALANVAHSKADTIKLLSETAPILRGLIKCTLRFTEIFSQMKKEKNLVDFSDIEHICIKLLSDEDIAKERRDFFEEIYVDEYQDSNAAQDYIFRTISGECEGRENVFMVGDVKQSIYGFRQTDPGLFLEKKDSYKFGDKKNRKIVLSKNFRSCEGIIDYINRVFEKIMSRSVGGIDYDQEERLQFAAPYPDRGKAAEIDIIETADLTGDDCIYAEAVCVAKRILSLMKNSKVYDLKEGREREIKFSDIAVLMRSPKRSVPVFEEVFKEFDIPLFVDYDDGYFESSETKTVLSLLTIIDNPENDIPLISVLRSPVAGFNEDELAKIRLCDKKSSFYKALCICSKGGDSLARKCAKFVDDLSRFRMYAKHMPCHRLIDEVLNETGYIDAVCAMPAAADRLENIALLTEQARNYENTSYRGLYNFINYINNVKEKSGNLGASKSIGDGHSVVRMMSIHKSKGLEFPVVFLSRCGQKMNTRDLSGDLILHSRCGIGISYADAKRRVIGDTALKTAAVIKKRQEDLSEEIRVLYVALTRAKEKLIITAHTKDGSKSMEKWRGLSSLLDKGFPIRETTYIDYIMAAYLCDNTGAVLNIQSPEEIEVEEDAGGKNLVLNPGEDEEVKKLLEFEYPFGNMWEIPSKVTVTELKRMKEALLSDDAMPLYPDISIKTPSFIEKEKISSARAGQLMHFVMQSIDINTTELEEVEKFVESLAEKNILTTEEAEIIDCRKIAAFFSSELGQRMKKADKVFREEPFAMSIPASAVTGREEDKNQQIMVQGIIDCYFFEGDKIVLVDYKTDKKCDRETILRNYKKQIDIYAEALEKKYFQKIYEKFIYLFGNSGIIRID